MDNKLLEITKKYQKQFSGKKNSFNSTMIIFNDKSSSNKKIKLSDSKENNRYVKIDKKNKIQNFNLNINSSLKNDSYQIFKTPTKNQSLNNSMSLVDSVKKKLMQ